MVRCGRQAREDHKSKLGHLLFVASQLGKSECPNGFRIVINDGDDWQVAAVTVKRASTNENSTKWRELDIG